MEKIQLGNVILFKDSSLGGLVECELHGLSDESGAWVSYNDICELLQFSRNTKKRVRRRHEDSMKLVSFKRESTQDIDEEYFIRDEEVYSLIMRDREERRITEQFIFDVLGDLNNGEVQDAFDAKYVKEMRAYRDWLDSDDEVFIARKQNNKIQTDILPTWDEALSVIDEFLKRE